MIKYFEEKSSAVIMLDRPEKRNALHPEMVMQLKEQLIKVRNNDKIRNLIISGEGKSFCAGADLEYLNELKNFSVVKNELDSEELADLFLSIYKFPKPTIAAVNGAAIAGGCGLASVCDIIVAHPENSKFGYSEVKIGFVPAIVSVFLIRRIGEAASKQLLLTGDFIKGKRAYEIGLVNYLSENPLEHALTLAENLSKNSAFSLEITKRIIETVSVMPVEDAVGYCIKINTISRESDDFTQGLINFLNKA